VAQVITQERPRLRLVAFAGSSDSDGPHGLSEPYGMSDGRTEPVASRRVLIVDDEPSIRLLTRVNLTASGIEVLEAPDGATGVELARNEHPDVVLLDVMMPDLDGWEVARQLAADEATAQIPIVFLTARTEHADRALGRELGGVAYLVKPFDPTVLADVIEGILERLDRGEREQLRREITERRGA
jgi:DNA-binding response OmpR family regulator